MNGAPDSVYKTKIKLDESDIFQMSSTPHSALKKPHTQSEPSERSSKKLRFETIDECSELPHYESNSYSPNDKVDFEHPLESSTHINSNFDVSTPWVQCSDLNLTPKHMETILQNEKLDCDIINYCQRLLSSTFKVSRAYRILGWFQ